MVISKKAENMQAGSLEKARHTDSKSQFAQQVHQATLELIKNVPKSSVSSSRLSLQKLIMVDEAYFIY